MFFLYVSLQLNKPSLKYFRDENHHLESRKGKTEKKRNKSLLHSTDLSKTSSTIFVLSDNYHVQSHSQHFEIYVSLNILNSPDRKTIFLFYLRFHG